PENNTTPSNTTRRPSALNPDQRQRRVVRGALQRVLCGEVIRVEVEGEHLRGDVEQPLPVGDAGGVGAQGGVVGEVSDVVGDQRRSEEHTSELESRENILC